jgi:hypothetical protein
MYQSIQELRNALAGRVRIRREGIDMLEGVTFQERLVDALVYNAVFNPDQNIKTVCKWILWEAGLELGIYSASIQELYEAKAKGEYPHMTVPAINIRGLTYDVARALIRAAKYSRAGAFIFEITQSEMEYTAQAPDEYATVVISAAIREGYQGPVFIQGDHFQINRERYYKQPTAELNTFKKLLRECISAGFYNMDIDTSTLVDTNKSTVREQQRPNFELTGLFVSYIRSIEPHGITVAIGGEIGDISEKNTTEEELRAYMHGLNEEIESGLKGIIKITVQTGAMHSGVPLSDGSIAQIKLDFDTLRKLSEIAIEEFKLAGGVQYGASTLPIDAFNKFPDANAAEVHLSTQIQNIIYDMYPISLKDEIYAYLKKEFGNELRKRETEEQFIYRIREKGFGPFKERIWSLPAAVKEAIRNKLEEKFKLIFDKLRVVDTWDMVKKQTKPVYIHKPIPDILIS